MNQMNQTLTSRTRYLLNDLNRSTHSFCQNYKNLQQLPNQSPIKPKPLQSPSKLTKEKSIAKIKYQQLTRMTKQQQRQMIWSQMQSDKKHKKQWTHSFYTGNNKTPHVEKTFTAYQKRYLQHYPDNNTKYNIQFLQRSLHGASLKFPRSESGEFKQPADSLYSRHYRPIVKEKVRFNEDWELRASLFGKVELDYKKDRIMDRYVLQANTFKTPRSNSLISAMTRSQMC